MGVMYQESSGNAVVVRSRFQAACSVCSSYLPPGFVWAVRGADGWTPYCDEHRHAGPTRGTVGVEIRGARR
jgi:hypothetical protein